MPKRLGLVTSIWCLQEVSILRLSLIGRLLFHLTKEANLLVGPVGIEPTTYGLKVRRYYR